MSIESSNIEEDQTVEQQEEVYVYHDKTIAKGRIERMSFNFSCHLKNWNYKLFGKIEVTALNPHIKLISADNEEVFVGSFIPVLLEQLQSIDFWNSVPKKNSGRRNIVRLYEESSKKKKSSDSVVANSSN